MNWYLTVLKNYVGFTGRARRTEFWMFALFNFLISLALTVISVLISDDNRILASLYSLAVLLPTLAVWVRRLHDTDHSGWWLLIGLIPVVGFIVLVVFAFRPGITGPDAYGPDPKQAPAFA
jgi:uncharacterized membrane protein YhaH (DUF805 family)